jgi:hypothetical protein
MKGRAKGEAQRQGVEIDFLGCDMRVAHDHHGRQFDMVIACDNSNSHLLNDDIRHALQMHGCTRPGGRRLITVRGYDWEERAPAS